MSLEALQIRVVQCPNCDRDHACLTPTGYNHHCQHCGSWFPVCEKCSRVIDPHYYSVHVTACQGPDRIFAARSGDAKGDPQASAPGIAPQCSGVAVSPSKPSTPTGSPAKLPDGNES